MVFAPTRTIHGLLIYCTTDVLAFFSPPFFCYFVWTNFLKSENQSDQSVWNTVMDSSTADTVASMAAATTELVHLG